MTRLQSGPPTLFGFRFDTGTTSAVVERLLTSARTRQGEWLITPNTDILRQAFEDPAIADLLHEATVRTPDGFPVSLALSLALGRRVLRITGANMLQPILAGAERHNLRVLLIAGRPDTGAHLAQILPRRFPALSWRVAQAPILQDRLACESFARDLLGSDVWQTHTSLPAG
jgi:UDP-N-acetyl-D-mannosaminuronic acid transferase (WecB/TagA/CpsF family)